MYHRKAAGGEGDKVSSLGLRCIKAVVAGLKTPPVGFMSGGTRLKSLRGLSVFCK